METAPASTARDRSGVTAGHRRHSERSAGRVTVNVGVGWPTAVATKGLRPVPCIDGGLHLLLACSVGTARDNRDLGAGFSSGLPDSSRSPVESA